MMFPDDFYTLAEVAAILKVSKSTVWRRARAGDFAPLDETFCRFRGDQLREWFQREQTPWGEPAQAA